MPKSSMEMVAPSSLSSPRQTLRRSRGPTSRPSSVTSNSRASPGRPDAASASLTSWGRSQSRRRPEGQVEGELQPQSGPPPVAGRAGRELDHLLGEGALWPPSATRSMNELGRDHAPGRMNPASEGLHADHTGAAEIDLRQEVGLDLAAIQAASDVGGSALAAPVFSLIRSHAGSMGSPLSPPRIAREPFVKSQRLPTFPQWVELLPGVSSCPGWTLGQALSPEDTGLRSDPNVRSHRWMREGWVLRRPEHAARRP